jgi:hypothetical protein
MEISILIKKFWNWFWFNPIRNLREFQEKIEWEIDHPNSDQQNGNNKH